MIKVVIKAVAVVNNGNGTFDIELVGGSPLTLEETNMIRKLLPNLEEKFYELLNKEALLSALAEPTDCNAPVSNFDKIGEVQPVKKTPKY